MADVRAFRGRYYDTDRAGDIGGLTAPPYDVIGPAEQRELLEASPYNVVRLILPEDDSPASPDWQKEAGLVFEAWKNAGIFRTSACGSIYLYRQAFDLPGGGRFNRTAFIALYRLEELGRDGIYPHERTFPLITREQLALLRACSASFSQVFSLFEDDDAYHAFLEQRALPSSRKLFTFEDHRGLGHELWELSDAALIAELRGLMSGKRVFIADGHHRYETSLLYRNESKTGAGEGNEDPRDFISMAFIGLNDPGLLLLPVHRLLKCGSLSPENAAGLLEPFCEIRELQGPDRDADVREACRLVLANTGTWPVFGLVTPAQVFLVKPRQFEEIVDELAGEHSREWAELDVTILHEVIFQRHLNLSGSDDAAGPYDIKYTVDLDEVIAATAGGEYGLGFLVRSPSLRAAWKIASLDEKMPHKSTYFYPKMPSGLVIYDHAAELPQIS